MKRIAVIGVGLSGAAFFINFIDKIRHFKNRAVEITLIDKFAVDGRGVAYRTPYASNLLNTPSLMMGLLSDNKEHFYSWLRLNQQRLLEIYPNLDFIHPPRYVYGNYIEDTLIKYIKIAEEYEIKITKKINIVCCLQKISSMYQVVFENQETACYDYVVLATGGEKKQTFPNYLKQENFFYSVYDESYPKLIKNNDDVIIMGSRLSAIDAALMLKEKAHKGKIYLISRGGMLSRVQAPLEPLPRKFFHYDFINSKNTLSLVDVFQAIKNEVFYHEKINLKLKELKYPKGNPASILRYEIMKSCKPRSWQNVLYTENHLVNLTWRKLSFKDKQRVYEKYTKYFALYRSTMPLINAKKIYSLMATNQLEVLKSSDKIKFNYFSNKFRGVVQNNRIIEARYLVDATGVTFDLNVTKPPLYKEAQKNKLIDLNAFGGVTVDGLSYEVLAQEAKEGSNLYALGGLSNGIDFGTNLAEFIIEASNKLSIGLVGKLQKNEC